MLVKAEALNNSESVNICPHCDNPLDKEDITCPACGKLYWQPESSPHAELADSESEDEALGCLPLFFWPLSISFAVTSFLILLGFIVHVFSHFGANQVKVIWILGSAAVGGFVYRVTLKIKKKYSKSL